MGALAKQQKRIVEFLAAHPEDDFTRKEIAAAIGMEHSTVCGRVNELLEYDPTAMPNNPRSRQWLDELAPRKCRISEKSAKPLRIHRPVGQLDLFKAAA